MKYNGRSLIKKFCEICNKKVKDYRSHLCKSCAGKINASKNGLPTCLDCGKKLGDYRAKRCQKCNTEYGIKNNGYWGCAGLKGKESYSWIDGRSFEPYSPEFTVECKESIRKRDNYECQNCGMTEEEHLIVYGQVLQVHHIDYDKKNCKEDNLITTCLSCNIRANYNRNYWIEFYTNKIVNLKKEL